MKPRKRKAPQVTVRKMTDEEWVAAQDKMSRKQAGLKRWADKATPFDPKRRGAFDENKRKIEAGETFRSQKPSEYRRKAKRK